MRRREKTFPIDYANVPVKPAYKEVHKFIACVLNLRKEQVERVQCSKALCCAFVKVVDLAIAQTIVEEHGNKHEIVSGEKAYPVRITLEDGAVEVRVTDLSEDVSDEAVVDFFGEYGDVISIHEELWGEGYRFEGFPNGVRVVKMMVEENIPSYVTIDG